MNHALRPGGEDRLSEVNGAKSARRTNVTGNKPRKLLRWNTQLTNLGAQVRILLGALRDAVAMYGEAQERVNDAISTKTHRAATA